MAPAAAETANGMFQGHPSGNQISVCLQKGKEYPPMCVTVRAKYEETVMDLKQKVAKEAGVPVEKQQLFWHHKELRDDLYGHLTMEKLRLHTGSSLRGYDLTAAPDYWPKVEETEKGLREIVGSTRKKTDEPEVDERVRMGYEDGLTMSEAIKKFRGPFWYSQPPPVVEFAVSIVIKGKAAAGTKEKVWICLDGDACRTGRVRVPDDTDLSAAGTHTFVITQPDVGNVKSFSCGLYNNTEVNAGILRFAAPVDPKALPPSWTITEVAIKNKVTNHQCTFSNDKTVKSEAEFTVTYGADDLKSKAHWADISAALTV